MNAPVYSQITCIPGMPSVQIVPLNFRRPREAAFSIEDPQYPLDDPASWIGGSVSDSGQRVTPCSMLSVPAAYQAVTRISGDIARSPLELWKETGDDVWKVQRSDPLTRLLSIQPNREQDAFTFWQQVVAHRLIYQKAFVFIATSRTGEPAELLPLLPDRTHARRKNGVLYFTTEVNGRREVLANERVIYLRGIGFDNLEAYELSKAMREAIGLALARMGMASRLFRRGGRKGGTLEIPLGMTKPSADRLEEGFRRKYEDPNEAFTTIVLRDNAKFHEAQMSLRDAQVIEGSQESVKDVARAFNVRPGILGEGKDGVYGNKYEDKSDYLDMTLRPLMAGIEGQCRIKLLPLERQARETFEHNTDDLLQLSPKEQFEAYGTGIEKRLITSNEGRGKLGYPPHPDGDKLGSPHTESQKQEPAGKKPAPRQPPRPDEEDQDSADEESDFARLQREHNLLVLRNLGDVARVIRGQAARACAGGARFCAWLDETLPTKRDNLVRAGLTPESAEAELSLIKDGLELAASSHSEATLREAVEEFFNQWEKRHEDRVEHAAREKRAES